MWTHFFNLTYPSNFKTAFIFYNAELYFEVFNFFLGQLAQNWRIVKVLSPKQKYLEKVSFASLTGYYLNFLPTLDLQLLDF